MQETTAPPERNNPSPVVLDFQSSPDAQAMPFARSLQLLLEAIVRQHSADVACLYACSEEKLTLCVRAGHLKHRIDSAQIELSAAAGEWLLTLESPEEISDASSDFRVGSFPEVILNGLNRITIAPLRIGEQLVGVLTAGWRSNEAEDDALPLVGGLAASATTLLARARKAEWATDVVAEIARLEAELADLKIADRAGEILARDSAAQKAQVVQRHVQRVLEGTDSASILRQQLDALRTQVRDRKLVNQAKTVLQQAKRMSEEEAYLHLRNASRRERRPIRDVADEILLSARVPAERSQM